MEWKGHQKHKDCITVGHKVKEVGFLRRLDDLFDLAHSDSLTIISIHEDLL